jgi:translation initiation factor 3 subunit I
MLSHVVHAAPSTLMAYECVTVYWLLTHHDSMLPHCLYFYYTERLGTFEGHNGAIWCCDITHNSKYMITGSGDSSCMIWDVSNGAMLKKITFKGTVRAVALSEGDKQFVASTDPFAKEPASIFVYNFPSNPSETSDAPALQIADTGMAKGEKVICAVWLPFNKAFMAGCSDGSLRLYDPTTGKIVQTLKEHTAAVQSIQFNHDKTMFITASSDFTAKLFDTETFKVLKVYQTERPVNSAAISPLFEHVMLGGGQEASAVTVTAGRTGKFEVRFFHTIYEEEFGRVKGHFGPINTLAFHPDGRSFVSGAEDGYIRLHHFDSEYFEKDKATEDELNRLAKMARKLELESLE